MTDLAPHLTAFLREHLPRDRNASPHTVATYAHCFALLVRFAAKLLGTRPSDLKIEDLGLDLVLRSLDQDRDRSRQQRSHAQRPAYRNPDILSLPRGQNPRLSGPSAAYPSVAKKADGHGVD